jgi:hypothetical protein
MKNQRSFGQPSSFCGRLNLGERLHRWVTVIHGRWTVGLWSALPYLERLAMDSNIVPAWGVDWAWRSSRSSKGRK